jgi:hypothetical protein
VDESATSTPGPIFIVGSSRSGTTLLRQILNGHERVWITGETRYFEDLRPRLRTDGSQQLDPGERGRCERYFARVSAGRRTGASEPDEVGREADRLGGSADAYFEAFCRVRARRRGAEIWGEKTPSHVFRISDLLAAWPTARVICLVGDPRAVVASTRDAWRRPVTGRRRNRKRYVRLQENYARARQQYNAVLSALLWNATVRAAYDARATFGPGAVFIQPYEELVSAPEEAVRRLAERLGIDYQESMLSDIRVVASSYASEDGKEGIATEPLARWSSTLTAEEIAVVQVVTRRYMRELGYERQETRPSALRLAALLGAMPIAVLRALAANRHRVGRTFEFAQRRLSPLFVRRGLRDPGAAATGTGPKVGDG